MNHHLTCIGLLAAAGLMIRPAVAQSQGKPLTIRLSGVSGGLPISTVVNGQRQPLGQLLAGSGTVVRTDRLVGKNQRVDVKVDTRDGQQQVLLVSGLDPECEDTPRRDEEGCKPIGGFVLDETSEISILGGPTGWSFGTAPGGVVSVSSRAPRAASSGLARRTFQFGLQGGYTKFFNFANGVRNQPGLNTSQADQSPFALGAHVTARPFALPLGLELAGYTVNHNFRQTFQNRSPVIGKVRGYFLQTNAYALLPAGRGTFMLGGGLAYALNQLLARDTSGLQLASRTHHGLKANAQLVYNFPLGGGFGCGAGVQYVHPLRGGDMDAHFAALLRVNRRFGL